jgi:hypothetical protein
LGLAGMVGYPKNSGVRVDTSEDVTTIHEIKQKDTC